MTQAALIILDDDRPTMPVLGLSWPEFQMRRAVRAGARHLVLVADRVSRDVVEAVDRLRAEGLSTTLARTAAEVADLFHPEEVVLLMTGSAVVGEAQLKSLLHATKPTLLCIDAERAGPGHELIDARSHWVGIARIDGAQVRATVTMVGDWDLGSTLLRKAVAGRALRTTLSGGDFLVDASDAAGAAQASRALVSGVSRVARGWGGQWVLEPLARLVVQSFSVILPSLARFGPLVAMVMFVLAPVVQGWQWTTAAVALFLFAALVAASVRIAAAATGITGRSERLICSIRDGAAVLLIGMIAAVTLPDPTPVVLAVGVVAFSVLGDRLFDVEGVTTPPWLSDSAGHAIILLIASLFGASGVLVGLALCAAHGLASLAFLQNRLSRVLTSLR